jgi:hypothetical protein
VPLQAEDLTSADISLDFKLVMRSFLEHDADGFHLCSTDYWLRLSHFKVTPDQLVSRQSPSVDGYAFSDLVDDQFHGQARPGTP